ncbi:hypothetical protein EWB00_006421 [Schistosoma japonicum]|uniref:Uncharacterized protein n=1 Tax=Schistosoma japonicum TaxID=6182 RepID=A0A4Z2CZ72_SCHJA|nr:hypothetical protein EWB00_006421 [Schistosoma japonicum]
MFATSNRNIERSLLPHILFVHLKDHSKSFCLKNQFNKAVEQRKWYIRLIATDQEMLTVLMYSGLWILFTVLRKNNHSFFNCGYYNLSNGAYDDVVSFFIVLLTSAILFMITMKYSYDITVIFYEYFYVFTLPLIFTPVLMVIFAITGYEIVFTKMFMVFTFIHFQFFTIITAQTLQGGHDVQIEIEDYVLGAMQMFIVILCSSLSLLTLFNNNSNEVYIWYKTVFLLFNIPLVYFAILVNEVNLKDKLMNNSK